MTSVMCSGDGGSVVPTGLDFNCWDAYPTLKRGANEHCAYGALVPNLNLALGAATCI